MATAEIYKKGSLAALRAERATKKQQSDKKNNILMPDKLTHDSLSAPKSTDSNHSKPNSGHIDEYGFVVSETTTEVTTEVTNDEADMDDGKYIKHNPLKQLIQWFSCYCPYSKTKNSKGENEKCQCDLSMYMPSISLVLYTIFALFIVMDISLLVININANGEEGTYLSVNYQCVNNIVIYKTIDTDPNTNTHKIDPNKWMITAAISGIIYSLLSFVRIYSLACHTGNINDTQGCSVVCATFVSIAIFIISCLGFNTYRTFDDQCKQSDIGICILCWSLLRFFASLADCGIVYVVCCCSPFLEWCCNKNV